MANENGWGDGVLNNDIGWGQGAVNNDIGWGSIYPFSNAGLTEIYGQSYQPEAAAFFTAIENAGGSISDNVKAEWNAFVVREKDASRYSKLKRLYPFLGGVIDSARVDAVTLGSATNFNFVDGDVDSLVGLQGDGDNKYLRESFGADDIFDSVFDWGMHLHLLSDVLPSVGDQIVMGSYTSSTSAQVFYNKRFTTQYAVRGNLTAINPIAPTLPISGESISGNRSANNSLKLYKNGVATNTDTTIDTGTLSSADMAYFVSSLGAGVLASYSNTLAGCMALWSGFNDADVSGFDTSYKTFINNIKIVANGWWDGSQTGLLDNYPSASAAYSVRALNSAYTGALLRVRRSSDNAEQDIHAMANGDLDTASLLTFVGANDGFVVTWYDQSTNGLNTTNSTASQQRQIVVSGVLITDNGKPASKDISTTTQYSTSTPVYAVDAPDVWTFSVQNAEDTLTNTSLIFGANTYNGFLVATWSNRESVDVRAVRTGGSSTGEMGVTGALVGQQILTTYADRVNVASFLNGVELSGTRADSDTNFLSVTFNTILGMQNSTARSFDGYFQEFIIYEVDQTANQSAIESNINTYYLIY